MIYDSKWNPLCIFKCIDSYIDVFERYLIPLHLSHVGSKFACNINYVVVAEGEPEDKAMVKPHPFCVAQAVFLTCLAASVSRGRVLSFSCCNCLLWPCLEEERR